MDLRISNKNVDYETSWFASLFRLLGRDVLSLPLADRLDEQGIRSSIINHVRWFVIALLVFYSFFAELLLSFWEDLPLLQLDSLRPFHMITMVLLAVAYIATSLPIKFWQDCRYKAYVQVLLDLFFVTFSIHLSGGALSWLWPAYMLVSLESSFLFEKRSEVWGIGFVGSLLYGMLLAAELSGVLPSFRMPFVNHVPSSALFNILIWSWVFGLNAIVACFATFLMRKISSDREKVSDSEEALIGFIESARDFIFCCNEDGTIIYMNDLGHSLFGMENGENGEVSIFSLANDEAALKLKEYFGRVLDGEEAGHFEISLNSVRTGMKTDLDVSLSSCSEGDKRKVIWGVCHDITERNLAQTKLRKMAHHDLLTGLPNRILLYDRMQQAKAFANRMNSCFGLMFLDLDRFKMINDTLGHAVGDDLLRMIAHRFRETLRETDTIARIGGDEFIILVPNVSGKSDIDALAEKLLTSMSVPFKVRSHELFVTTSVGICMYPEHEQDIDSMMQKADIAMYHAKSLGRNNYQYYSNEMSQDASRRFVIANTMRKGIDQHEFQLYYQPKVDMASGRIIAMEALVRWRHPELGLLSPNEFIQIAEENGMIFDLGEWVLREACQQNCVWHAIGMEGLRVSVNLSGYQLQHNQFINMVKTVLQEVGIPPESLEFEITESVIMQNPDFAVSVLDEITRMGIQVSIDDFGTGYSSLSHIKRFAVNTLKIDKTFVRDVENNETDAAIATAIIAMGSSLKLKIIAEGVETEQQMDFLRDNNCDQAQGFLISEPLPPDDFLKILLDNWSK